MECLFFEPNWLLVTLRDVMFFKKPAHRSRPNICHFKKYLWASIAREEALLFMFKRLLT